MTDRLEMPLEQFAEAVAKENARLTECLKVANEKHEHFEREWYLAKDRIEQLEEALLSVQRMFRLDLYQQIEDGPHYNQALKDVSNRINAALSNTEEK